MRKRTSNGFVTLMMVIKIFALAFYITLSFNSLAILECNIMLDNACGNGLVTKGDAVEMMHVGVHLVYRCLSLEQEMRISE